MAWVSVSPAKMVITKLLKDVKISTNAILVFTIAMNPSYVKTQKDTSNAGVVMVST